MDKQQKIEALFAKAKLTPTAIPFTESKGIFMKNLEAGVTPPKGKTQFLNLKNILIMIGILGALSFVISMSITGEQASEVKTEKSEIQHKVPTINNSNETVENQVEENIQKSNTSNEDLWMDLIKPLPVKEIYLTRELALVRHRKVTPKHFSQITDQIQFPKLTEKEIAANHKQKRKMVKALSKFDRKKYAYIPTGSYLHEGVPISVQAFYMQREEVTNLEYRTFIFDLLIQGRKNEFLIAAPDQTLWTKVSCDTLHYLQNGYFSDPALNNFPVVNVSKKGVEMYCKWITVETNKTKKSDLINDVRIPQLLEWIYAASNLGQETTYPWEGNQLTKDDNFNANFKFDEYSGSMDMIKKKAACPTNARTTFECTFGTIIAWVKSYEPTELGLYEMSGNVAEMVSTSMLPNTIQIEEPGENQLVTCGGSWMSPIEDLKIFNENISDHINGHPSIGFRVVITYLNNN